MKAMQLLPGFGSGDAISNYALQLQEIIRGWGVPSPLYCVERHVSSVARDRCEDYRRCLLPGDDADIVIYHYSIGSELSDFFRRVKGHKILVYHNITPHRYFAGIHEEKMKALWEGREELKSLAGVPDRAVGVSEYNRRELCEMGFRSTGVLPLIVDRKKLSVQPDVSFIERYGDGRTNLFFVGRVAPNKRLEELIKIFYYYRKTVNERSRLLIAGSAIGMDRYVDHLRALITALDVPDIVFLDHVKDPELYALYKTANYFICTSEHEGFCIPLLEAMHFGVPVIAYAAAAVPETVGDCGVLVREKDHIAVAELIGALDRDEALRNAIVKKQFKRLESFSPQSVADKLRSLLSPWLEAGGNRGGKR
jgi:glycosyltransferase involved in cell wall biosynthesis